MGLSTGLITGQSPLGAADDLDRPSRVVDAALRCITRRGVQRTTVDHIAREAAISRATLYRTFPGGRDAVLATLVEVESTRFFTALAVVMGEAHDLEDVLVAGMVEAARRLSGHAALTHLLEHEPGVVLPRLAFAELDRLLAVATAFSAPFFGRWLEPDQAVRVAEWAVRIVLSYLSSPRVGSDLTDPDQARHLVATFMIPGVHALQTAAATGDSLRRES